MPDYARMNRELPGLKRMLTRAKRSNDPYRVLEAVEKAVDAFDQFGWPDNWPTWRIALDDAFFAYSRSDRYTPANVDEWHRIADRFV